MKAFVTRVNPINSSAHVYYGISINTADRLTNQELRGQSYDASRFDFKYAQTLSYSNSLEEEFDIDDDTYMTSERVINCNAERKLSHSKLFPQSQKGLVYNRHRERNKTIARALERQRIHQHQL